MDTLKVDSCSFAEQFMLWAIRVSLSAGTTTAQANKTLTEAFRLLRVPGALHPFLDFVGVAAAAWHNAQYMPDVRCTCCSTIGEDEWRLLQILAALQRRDLNLAACWLRDVLPPAGTRILITSGLQVANSLLQRGCMLSLAATTLQQATATVRQHAANAPLH